MSRFVLQSACRGQRPAGAAPRLQASRPALISRLLSDRRALRVVSAPGGFGKTALACEYADVVFGFQQTYWLNGQSPCFLRDLDAEVIGECLLREPGMCSLVVFDDVPWMDDDRAERFDILVAALIEAGVEVLATTTPARDRCDALTVPLVRIDGRDLLVGDEEGMDDAMTARARRDPSALAARIPCLRWSDEGAACLVRGVAREPLPADLRLVLWLMMALERGSAEDLALFTGESRVREAWDYLIPRYPFVAIESEDGVFEAAAVDIDDLREGVGASFEALAAASMQGGRDALALAVTRWLMRGGRVDRAARMLGAFASKAAISTWLPCEGSMLLWHGAGAAFCELHDRVARQRVSDRAAVNAMMAVACAEQQDDRRALEFARRAVGSAAKSSKTLAAAALAAHARANRDTRATMEALLAEWRVAAGAGASADGEKAALDLLADVVLAGGRPDEALQQWVRACTGAGAVNWEVAPWPQGLLLAAAWVLDTLAATGALEPRHEDAALLGDESFALLVAVAVAGVDELASAGTLGLGGLRAVEALERVESALTLAELPLPGAAASRVAARQRSEHAMRVAGDRLRRAGASATTMRASAGRRLGTVGVPRRQGTEVPLLAPQLHVRLFGAMTVRLGDVEVGQRIFARKKARLLLALLVLHRGRELTREALTGILWPQATPRTGAKSFYRLWGELEKILSVEGSCPYMVRDHHRCQLNPLLCTSDVMEFEGLVRTLLFGLSGAAEGWEDVLRQVQESFSAELLPAEDRCEEIAVFRRRYAVELVDGLVAASCRLREAGELQGALWFAREALRRDGTREDVCGCLMAAQMAVGQRGGALDTFFSCRDYLSEELGLDPSPQIMELYHCLIEGRPAAKAGR